MVYNWAGENHMYSNKLKFQVLRIGSNKVLKEDMVFFSPDYEEVEETKGVIKDLGIKTKRIGLLNLICHSRS